MKRAARGFTIIEMLAIIAVVVLLGMLFTPCICTSPPLARRAACLSHMKQIGLVTAMYVQDYDDTLPWNPAPGGLPKSQEKAAKPGACAAHPTTSFVLMLLPYLRNPSVFQCPEYPGYHLTRHLGYAKSLTSAGRDEGISDLTDPDWYRKIGYGFNEVLIGDPCRARTHASLKHEPGEVALFADAARPWASSDGVWAEQDGGWGRYWIWNPAEPMRHAKGQNFVFADGHARWLQPVGENGEAEGETPAAGRGYFPNARLE
jgi:prepilin-type processing-associated H-X9-DG protein